MRTLFILVGLGTLVVDQAAMAQAEPRSSRMEPTPVVAATTLPTTCQEGLDFESRVLHRTRLLRRARPKESALALGVTLWRTESGYGGRLTMREIDGTESQRVIEGPTCDAVLDALALVASVLVDQARQGPESPGKARLSGPRVRISRSQVELGGARWQGGVGVMLGANQATGPGFPWGPSLRLTLEREPRGPWAPAFGLALEKRGTSRSGNDYGEAVFKALSLRGSYSPLGWPKRGWLRLRPELGFELGRVSADGHYGSEGDSTSVTYATIEGDAWLEARILPELFVVTEAGVSTPLTHDRFYFATPEGPRELDKVMVPGLVLRLGLFSRFP